MAIEALPMIKRIEIINKKKFVAIVINIDNETFMLPIITFVEVIVILIYFFFKA